VCQSATWDAKCPGKSEVSELDASVYVDEQILGLEVTMDHSVAVAVRQTLQQLVQVTLHAQHQQLQEASTHKSDHARNGSEVITSTSMGTDLYPHMPNLCPHAARISSVIFLSALRISAVL